MPAAADVLSGAKSWTNLKCIACNVRSASIVRASWASVSKHARYVCARSVREGQNCRSSVMLQDSENQENWEDVMIHPPMPMTFDVAFSHGVSSCHVLKQWRLAHGVHLLVMKAGAEPAEGLFAFTAQMYLAPVGVCKAHPPGLMRPSDK